MADVPKQQIAEPCSSRCDEDLLEDFDSSDEGNINSEDEMSEEEPQVLTNGLVCEFYNKFKDLTWNEVKFKGEFCVSKADCDGQDLSVYTKIERTFKNWKSLRGKKAKEFINTKFKPPSSPADYLAFVVKDTPHKKELKQNLLKTRKDNRGLKRKLEDSFEEIKSMDNEMNQLSYQYEKTFVVVPELERDEEIKKQKELFQITFHEATMKRKSKASKTKLDLYLKDPSLLVGKRIKHLVQDDKNSKPEWYDATVTKIEKTNENPIKTVFEIIYDIDGEDEQFNYPLLTDLNNKKLVILCVKFQPDAQENVKDLYAISQAAVGYRKAAQDLADALFSYEELSTSSVRGFGTVKGQDPKEGLDGKRLGTLYKCVKKYHGSASASFINSALRDHFKKYWKQAEKAARNREQAAAAAAAANQQPPPDV